MCVRLHESSVNGYEECNLIFVLASSTSCVKFIYKCLISLITSELIDVMQLIKKCFRFRKDFVCATARYEGMAVRRTSSYGRLLKC